MAGMSSAVRGLIPKSTGGRMALGAGGAVGLAAGVSGYRNRRKQQEYDAFRQRVVNSIQLTEVTPQGQPIRTYGPGNIGMREV